VVLGLATIALPEASRWPALTALAVANLSQFLVDVRVRRLGLAHGAMFLQILIGDAVFTLANIVAAVATL
jgi:hypothetical protein